MAKKKYQKSEPEVNQNAAAAPAEEQLATPATETESAAAAPEAEAPEVKTQWGPIVKDFCILLVIMGILGYACNLLKDAFAHKSPTDSLVSLIRKGDLKEVNGEEVDEPFLKELKDGKPCLGGIYRRGGAFILLVSLVGAVKDAFGLLAPE